MKKQLFILFLFGIQLTYSQVTGINTANAAGTNASALLEIKSTTGGFLPPRMTLTERNAIATPATGLLIYNTTANSYETYNGTAWYSINAKDTNPPTSSSALISSYQFQNPIGKLEVGSSASAVSLPLKVYVNQLGSYNFSTTTANGISFTATGTFTTLGLQTIHLVGVGTPLAVGFHTYMLKNITLPPTPVTIPTTDIHTVVGSAGKIWMAYNLGATAPATSATDYTQYGSLYQWGRGNDGHQLINWTSPTAGTPVNGTTTTLSTTDTPGHMLFIINPTPPNDWCSPQNNSLWQGVNGTNNPCPAGFRLPTDTEWTAEITASGITNTATAYSSSLKLVASGLRNYSNGEVFNSGTGYYWSSTASGKNALNRNFNTGASNSVIYYRAAGFTVRCLKD